ncbi:MAG: hypothetical protein Kow00106_10410 [Anaerolineae bacterium]
MRRFLANRHSIRWWLPFSYAGIALLAVAALSGLLLFTLRRHYSDMERRYLEVSAEAIAHSAERLFLDRATLPDEVFQSSASIYSFLVKSRVRLLDVGLQVVADSGSVAEQRPDTVIVNVRGPAEGGSGEVGPPQGFETFLSIRQPEPALLPEGEGTPRYPVPMPRRLENQGWVGGIVTTDSHTDLSLTVPLFDREGTLLGYVELSESPAFGRDVIRDVAEKAILAGAMAVLLAASAGWVVSRRISQPVLALAQVTQHMAEGDLTVRTTLQRRDELGLLARSFNLMAERIEDTVLTLKRFVADAAHEINTPITALRTNLELAAGGALSADGLADLVRAQAELTRLETLTQSLLTLSRLEAHGVERIRTPVDLGALVRQVTENFASRAEQAGITLSFDLPAESPVVLGDEEQLARVLNNLLDNALKFTPAGGAVTLGVESAPEEVRVSVTDTGIGIPPEDLPRLFSRFHRGRNAAAYPGNGLGLVIAKAIVEEHGGQISVQSAGAGTSVVFTLPREG